MTPTEISPAPAPASPGPRRGKPPAWLLLAIGTVLGAAVTLAIRSQGVADSGSKTTMRSDAQPPPAIRTPEKAPGEEKSAEEETPSVPDVQAQEPGTEGGPGAPAGVPGVPSAGAGLAPSPTILGTLPIGPMAPVNPVVIDDSAAIAERDKAAKAPTMLTEIRISVSPAEIEPAAAKVAGIAKEAGGSSSSFTEVATKEVKERRGFLLVLPAKKLKDATQELLKIGIASILDEWIGPAADRAVRVERPLRDVLHNLESEQNALLDRYLEDSPYIADVNERVEAARRELARVPSAAADKAIVRVYVGR